MDQPKPLTRAEWEANRATLVMVGEASEPIAATIDALFRYRERTRGGSVKCESIAGDWQTDMDTDIIAAEEGIE